MPLAAVMCAALCALACGHAPLALTPPPSPPSGAARERAEAEACRAGVLPPWLDDQALAATERMERYETQAFDPRESYAAGTAGTHAATLPPPRPSDRSAASSRTVALMTERVAFAERCEVRRRGAASPAPAP